MSARIPVHQNGSKIYDILLRQDFSDLAAELTQIGLSGHKACIVSDSNVAPLYLDKLKEAVSKVSPVYQFIFEAGESSKNLYTVKDLYTFLIENHFDRKDYLIALGGGVTGDLTGYAAATYLRGISFVQVPTSLLAQVDSSIGGKTGVDFDAYKNMVGAFHMPKLVYMNLSTLSSLDSRQFSNGMAEIVKHGFIKDSAYLDQILENAAAVKSGDFEALSSMIKRSCEIKRDVVENDPYEQGERALLNYGHTLGHAIEKLKDFQLLHGECVAIGCVGAAYLSMNKGLLSAKEYDKLIRSLKAFDLPVSFDGLNDDDILYATKSDKKMESGSIKFILLDGVGHGIIDKTLTDAQLLSALKEIHDGE